MLRRGWDPGPCHSPPGNAEPGRRAHPPSTPAAVPVPTGPWPRHSCAHCSRWSQVLLPRKQGEPCRSDTWDLGDARLGVWSGGWEPLPRSSDAPCTGSQTELPRALGPSEVGWETAVGAAFPSSAFAPGSPEWALHSVPGWVQPSLGDRLTLTEQKGKLRPGAGDPAQGAAAEGRTSPAPQGLCFVPGAGGPSRLHPQTFETPEGSEPWGEARPRSPAERRPAPAGCAAPAGLLRDAFPRERQAYFQTIVGKRVRPRPALPPARLPGLPSRVSGIQPGKAPGLCRGAPARPARRGLRSRGAPAAAPPVQVPAVTPHKTAHQRGDPRNLRPSVDGSPGPPAQEGASESS